MIEMAFFVMEILHESGGRDTVATIGFQKDELVLDCSYNEFGFCNMSTFTQFPWDTFYGNFSKYIDQCILRKLRRIS